MCILDERWRDSRACVFQMSGGEAPGHVYGERLQGYDERWRDSRACVF